MLVSWLNYLDVYSFRENDTRGHLASPEHDMRNQRIREANELLNGITQSSAFLQLSKAPELDLLFRELSLHPHWLEMSAESTVGKNTVFAN